MKYDPKNLFIAGVTDCTEYDTPDIVFAYPSESSEMPEGFSPDPEVVQGGDVILVGPLGKDGLIDPAQCGVFMLDEQTLEPSRMHPAEFRWVNELRVYQPISNLAAYRRGAEAQWQANKVVDL